MRALLLFAWLLLAPLLAPPAPLAAQEGATIEDGRAPLFSGRDALLLGAASLGTVVLAPLDVHVAALVQDSARQANHWLRTTAGGFRALGWPGTAAVAGGLYLAGRLTFEPGLAELGVRTGEAVVVAELVTLLGKTLAGRARPHNDVSNPFNFGLGRGFRSDDYQSFPSGHTSAAFAVAAVLHAEARERSPEAGLIAGSLLYTGATLVGLSRLYHNQHWLSDVAMGAAIGAAAGYKVAGYHRDRPHSRFDRWILSVSLSGGGSARLVLVPLGGG